MEDREKYHYVMLTHNGYTQVQAQYRSPDSARRRADGITGEGKVEIWESWCSDPEEARQEYIREGL